MTKLLIHDIQKKLSMNQDSKYKKSHTDIEKRIGLIFTGGTFLSTDTKNNGRAVNTAGSSENIEKTINTIRNICSFEPLHPINIDSSDLIPENWTKITNLLKEHTELPDEQRFDGYVIVHGTDTMEYTASALSFMCKGSKTPIILTGSMESIETPNSDAPSNLIKSIISASSNDLEGVHVAFDKRLLLGSQIKKTHPESRDTFDTLDIPPVGLFKSKHKEDKDLIPYDLYLHEGLVLKLAQLAIKNTKSKIYTELCTDIEIIKLTPFTDLSIFDYHIQKGTSAIIIEGFGDGNAPAFHVQEIQKEIDIFGTDTKQRKNQNAARGKILAEKIQACINKGIYVVLGSQCNKGTVTHKYSGGKQMLETGVLSAKNMTTPAIYGKLSHLLKYSSSLALDFEKDIVGELLTMKELI